MTEWISVTKELPNNQRMVLVTYLGLIGFTYWDSHNKKWDADIRNADGTWSEYIRIHEPRIDYEIECLSESITHWAELPEPPKE